MKKMNEYERHAYLYSAWTEMILPILVCGVLAWNYGIWENLNVFFRGVSTFLPVAIVYAAVGYAAREMFRSTSKMLFQFPIFKEDETKMPTTEMLLYKSKLISRYENDCIRRKVFADSGLKMMTPEEELQDEYEARKNIIAAVGVIRNVTRNDKIVEQANYRYGFCRNLLGGLVWAFVILVSIFVACLFMSCSYWWIPLVGIVFVIVQGLFNYWSYKARARNYARTLFNAYMTTTVKK